MSVAPPWLKSHELIVRELTAELSFAGLQVSCAPRRIPRATTLADNHLIGDIAIFNSDVSTDPYYPQHSPVVLDVSLTHSGQQYGPSRSAFVFRDQSVASVEQDKLRKYYSSYRTDSCGFVPVIADTYGRLGPKALRLFKRISDLFQTGSSPSSSSSGSFPSGCRYHALRLRLLWASLEASASRLLSDWGVLQPAASDSSQSSSAASSQIPTSPLSLSHPLPPASFSLGSPPPSSSLPSRPVAAPASVSPGHAIPSLAATLLADLATTYASQTSSPSQPASSADVVAPPSAGAS